MSQVQKIGDFIVITLFEHKRVFECGKMTYKLGGEVGKITFVPSFIDGEYVKVIEGRGAQDAERITHDELLEWVRSFSYFPRRRPRNR